MGGWLSPSQTYTNRGPPSTHTYTHKRDAMDKVYAGSGLKQASHMGGAKT